MVGVASEDRVSSFVRGAGDRLEVLEALFHALVKVSVISVSAPSNIVITLASMMDHRSPNRSPSTLHISRLHSM